MHFGGLGVRGGGGEQEEGDWCKMEEAFSLFLTFTIKIIHRFFLQDFDRVLTSKNVVLIYYPLSIFRE